MQLPTHLIVGILIQFVVSSLIPTPSWFSLHLIITVAFCSHFFLDAVAKITYHPPERIHDNFWLTWHIFVYLSGFIIILLFFQEYWLGMLFANLPDLWDWYTLRNIASRKHQPKWGEKYYLHPVGDKFLSSYFKWIPNRRYKRIGILPELSITTLWILITIFYLLE